MQPQPDPGRERELLAGAEKRIERHPKADAAVVVKASSGRPVRGAQVSVTQTRHDGMIHPFFSLAGIIDGGRTAIADAAAALRAAPAVQERV